MYGIAPMVEFLSYIRIIFSRIKFFMFWEYNTFLRSLFKCKNKMKISEMEDSKVLFLSYA